MYFSYHTLLQINRVREEREWKGRMFFCMWTHIQSSLPQIHAVLPCRTTVKDLQTYPSWVWSNKLSCRMGNNHRPVLEEPWEQVSENVDWEEHSWACKKEKKWYWQLGRKEGKQQESAPQSSPVHNLLCFRGETDIPVCGVLSTTRTGPLSKVPTCQSHPVFSCLSVNDKYLFPLVWEYGQLFCWGRKGPHNIHLGIFSYCPSPQLPHLFLGKGR